MTDNHTLYSVLSIVFNGEETLRYERSLSPTEPQLQYLNSLDQKLEQGFEYQGKLIEHPEDTQKSGFMALQLLDALLTGDDQIAAASCAWLATRLPDLKQVRFVTSENDSNIELVFDRSLEQSQREQVVTFVQRKPH